MNSEEAHGPAGESVPAKARAVSLDEAYAYHIVKTARIMRWYWRRLMRDLGLDTTQEQWILLNRLADRDGQSPIELTDEIFFDKPNISRMLASMQRRGLVERRPDATDGRRLRIFLTPRGCEVHGRIADHVATARRQAYKGLADRDLEDLRRILRVLEQNALEAG